LDYATDCTIFKWTDVQRRPVWLLAKVTSHFLSVGVLFLSADSWPTGWHQLYDLAGKDGVLLVLSMKKSHLSKTNDCLSRTSESPHATPASILISCRQPMTHRLITLCLGKAQTTKSTHSLLLHASRSVTNYKVHEEHASTWIGLFWKVPERLMTHRLRNQHARVQYMAVIAKSIRTRHSASLTC
jgi:hypothetical protein